MNQPPSEIEEQRAEEHDAADEVGPKREGTEPREWLVARAEHLRQHQDAHCLDHRHREQEHHHRAVHGEDLVVGLLAEERVARHRELQPHQQRENAGQYEEQQRGADVKVADHRVVDVADDPPAFRRGPDAPKFGQLSRRARRGIWILEPGLGGGHGAYLKLMR
jgi:hypothetical protein